MPPAEDHKGRRSDSRSRAVWIAVALTGMLLLAAGVSVAYLLRVTSEPAGSGPAYTKDWERFVRQHPSDVRARVELGYAYRATGNDAAALRHLDYAVRREPRNTAARFNRGMVYLSQGKQKKAEKDLWVVLESKPDHASAAIALGDYYAQKRQFRSLLVAVRPVLEEQPRIAQLQYLTALAYENTGHPEWAAARYRRALQLDPDLLEAREGLERLESVRQ